MKIDEDRKFIFHKLAYSLKHGEVQQLTGEFQVQHMQTLVEYLEREENIFVPPSTHNFLDDIPEKIVDPKIYIDDGSLKIDIKEWG